MKHYRDNRGAAAGHSSEMGMEMEEGRSGIKTKDAGCTGSMDPAQEGLRGVEIQLRQASGLARGRRNSLRSRVILGNYAHTPIAITLLYLLFTIVIFEFGPWQWNVDNKISLYGFLMAANMALFIGYEYQIPHLRLATKYHSNIETLFIICLFAFIVQRVILGMIGGVSLVNLADALANPGLAYLNRFNLEAHSGINFVELAKLVFAPFSVMVLPLMIVYWKQLKVIYRICGVGLLCLDTLMWMSIGTNKGSFDNALLLVSFMIVRWISNNHSRHVKVSIVKCTAVVILLGGVFYSFLLYFGANMHGRGLIDLETATSEHSSYRADHFVIRQLPPDVGFSIGMLSSYLTHGYYGLSICLKKDFVPCYGIGHSMFLCRTYEKVFDCEDQMINRTYPGRTIEDGWGPYDVWSSIYPWIASDVGFLGAIVVMFFIGKLLCIIWHDAIIVRNPFALGLLVHLIVLIVYIPANNQVLQYPVGFAGFWGNMILWYLDRRSVSDKPRKRIIQNRGNDR